jgi:hypothetical protein
MKNADWLDVAALPNDFDQARSDLRIESYDQHRSHLHTQEIQE